MKTLTHAQKVKQQAKSVKEQVQAVLGWSHEQYCEFQFKMGYRYLNLETEGNYTETQKMAENRLFWSWWMNHWTKRDKEFVAFLENIKVESFLYGV